MFIYWNYQNISIQVQWTMLRRLFIGERNALSPVLSVVLVLAIVMPAVGTVFVYGIPAINDLNEQKEREKGKNILGSVAEEVIGLTNSEFNDSTTVNFDLGKDSSVSVDTGTDRTVLMYSTDSQYTFTVSDIDNKDNSFLLDLGASHINQLKANFYFINPKKETCFLAGTKILMADGTYKNIEDARIGDLVRSYDEKSGKLTDGIVTHVFSHTPDEMGDYYLVINNQLRVTPNHRFYSDGKWVYASDLKIGARLFTCSGHDYIIHSIDKIFNKVPTFDLEIQSCHTYFVSFDCDKVNVLVHNNEEIPLDAVQDVYFYDSDFPPTKYCSFLKFPIDYIIYLSPRPDDILSVKLKIFVTYKDESYWDGLMRFSDIRDERWIEDDGEKVIWDAGTNPSVTIDDSKFDGPVGKYWESADLKEIFMSDYQVPSDSCSIKMEHQNYCLDKFAGMTKDGPLYVGYYDNVIERMDRYIIFDSRTDQSTPQLIVTIDTPPSNPVKPGVDMTGVTGVSYDFTTYSYDLGDLVKYGWDWNGDGTVDQWDDNNGNYYASGQQVTLSHWWSNPGIYNVKVIAQDFYGKLSDYWSDPVRVQIITNSPPNDPFAPTGPNSLRTGIQGQYSTSTSDPEGNNVSYRFDWGDGTISSWIGPYKSGQTGNASYSWSSPGKYSIKAQAKDEYGALSGWSLTYEVNVKPRPTVNINVSLNGKTVRGTININGTASATVMKVEVSFNNDGKWIEAKYDPARYEWNYDWDTTQGGISEGKNTISAQSFDGEYYSVVDSADVFVQNIAGGQGVKRQDENKKIDKYGACIIIPQGSKYLISLPHPIQGIGVVDLYDYVGGNDHYFGSIWFFDSNSITYEPSGDRLSSLIIENGLLLDKTPGYSSTVRDIPNIIDRNGILSLSIYQLVQSTNSAISATGGSSRINLRSYGSGMSIRDRFNKVYDFKIQFYGDNSNAWVNYLADPNNYLNFVQITSNSVERLGSVNLVLWHTYIEFGINI